MAANERRWKLLSLLHEVQDEFGYLPTERIAAIAKQVGASASEVRSVASFYDCFRFNSPGRHSVRVCTGTACHVKGSSLVLSEWERELGITAGQTTESGEFDLDEVACVGCCNLACAVVVDGEVQGGFKAPDVRRAIEQVRLADEQAAADGRRESELQEGTR